MTYQTQTLHQMKNNLKSLNPMELQELDEVITPRAAELLSKAFGPGIFELLAPLTEDDHLDEEADTAEMNDLPDTSSFSSENGVGSENGLRRMMRDPRYWKERDPTYIQKVTQGFQSLYPEQKD